MQTEINIQENESAAAETQLVFSNDVNGTNVKAVYEYVMRKAPKRAMELFDNLPPQYAAVEHPELQLTDENNWVTSELAVRVFQNAKKILNDPEAAYHIGFEQITRREFGNFQKLFIYQTFPRDLKANFGDSSQIASI